MGKQYDEEYRKLVSKLNDAFQQKKENSVSQSAFLKIAQNAQKVIANIPNEELQKIKQKIRCNVLDISYVTEREKMLISEIDKGRKRNYRQVIWHVKGNIHPKQIMENYTKLMQSEEVFHSVYFYQGLEEPVRVVYEKGDQVFPIHDIRNISHEKQNFVMKNVLASEARREYHPETDPVLFMQGFLTDKEDMLVVLSLYPHVCYSIGARGMLYKIFDQMKVEAPDVSYIDEKTVQKMNETIHRKSIAYWKNLLLPLSKSMTIPGENRDQKRKFEKIYLYKELEEPLVKELLEFSEKNKVSIKSVFLYAWANLLGRYHDEKNPVFAVTHKGELLQIYPVKISRNLSASKAIPDINAQLKESEKYSSCTIQDIEKACGMVFSEYFHMLHNFVEFSELDKMASGGSDIRPINEIHEDEIDINLVVNYQLFDKNIAIHYSAKSGMMEIILENLHELFIQELMVLIHVVQPDFQKRTFIQVDDTQKEKLQKMRQTQIGLYLKNSGIFESLNLEEIMELAQQCKLKTYLLNDVVALEKQNLSAIYIVGEGQLEESLTGTDGIVKSLRIIKKGTVFGIESLLSDNTAKTSYTVASNQVKVVEVEKEVFIEILRRNPQGWKALLERENRQKTILQKLWTIE